MTLTQFVNYIRYHTKTNSTTFPDADILALANPIKDDLAKEILRANEDIFGMEYLRDLVAGQREYSLPNELLNQIKYVEAKLDGTNWKKLTETDLSQYGYPTDETNIRYYYSGKYNFDIFRNSLWILNGDAIISVVEGLKLWAIQFPEDLTTLSGSTDMSVPTSNITVAMPKVSHEIWARKIIIAYKESKEKPIPLTEREQIVDKDLTLMLNSLRGLNLDRAVQATIPKDDGQNY